jgi:hypothetical protein
MLQGKAWGKADGCCRFFNGDQNDTQMRSVLVWMRELEGNAAANPA